MTALVSHLGLVGVVQAPLALHHQREVIDPGEPVHRALGPAVGQQVAHGVYRHVTPLVTLERPVVPELNVFKLVPQID